ncbi:hypothetical protein [Argonema galeatum]|nr:hypothetical protein [Argonema galeatum]
MPRIEINRDRKLRFFSFTYFEEAEPLGWGSQVELGEWRSTW